MLQLGFWRTIVDYFRRWNTYHDLAAEGEATYSIANANGNADEQYVCIYIYRNGFCERFCHSKSISTKYEELFSNFRLICDVYFRLRFIVKDRCTSYSSSQRSLMVMQVLLRTKYDDSEKVKRMKLSFSQIIILEYLLKMSDPLTKSESTICGFVAF